MHISFKSAQLRTTCTNLNKLTRKYGDRRARLVMLRLQQLGAMETLAVARTLPQMRCHELTGDRRGLLAVALDHPCRLLFRVDQTPCPVKKDGGLDWQAVHTIQIVDIEDYHGKRRKK